MTNRGNHKHSSFFGMIVLTVLVLAVSTMLMVLIGKRLLEHENSQTDRIEALEKEKNTLNDSIIDKDATIEELIEHLANAEKQIDALEDAYDLNAGKVKALEEWKADIEKQIEEGELSSDKKTSDDKKEESDDKKKDSDKDSDKEKDKDNTDGKEEKNDSKSKSKGVYQKLVNGENINLLIIGDSIGRPMDDTSWVVLLQNWIKNTYNVECNVTNVSMDGNTSYAGYSRTMILPEGDSYDLAIICYGHNDFDYGFGDVYELIIRAVMQRFPSCAMISILESSQREYTSKIRDIQNVCEYYNIPTADTIKAFWDSGIAYDELAPDGVHPEGTGRKIYFDTIKSIIKGKVENNETYTYAERSPINSSFSNEFDKVTYIKAEEFDRIDDLTFEYKGKINANIGVYWSKASERTGYAFVVDGETLIDYRSDWGLEGEIPIIHRTVSSRVKAKDSIRLVFATKECADLFKGMICSK